MGAYRLTLVSGPRLLYTDRDGEDQGVTRTSHQYLWDLLLIRPEVRLWELLRVGHDNSVLAAIYRRSHYSTINKVVSAALSNGIGTVESKEQLGMHNWSGSLEFSPIVANSELSDFTLNELLPMSLRMPPRPAGETPHPSEVGLEREVVLLPFGEVLLAAYDMAWDQLWWERRKNRSKDSYVQDRDEGFDMDDSDGSDPDYNHDNGLDPLTPHEDDPW